MNQNYNRYNNNSNNSSRSYNNPGYRQPGQPQNQSGYGRQPSRNPNGGYNGAPNGANSSANGHSDRFYIYTEDGRRHTYNTNDDSKQLVTRVTALVSMAVVILLSAWLLPSSAQMSLGTQAVNTSDVNLELESGIANIASAALRGVYELPEVFILPVSCDPGPEPNESRFEVVMNADGKRIDEGTYEDSTISVKVWKEFRNDTTYNFAEVTIAHPTQFRTSFASGSFAAATSYETPLVIAQKANAVVGMNSDFCRYNQNGSVIIRGGQLYKQSPNGWEVLLVDSKGDFYFAKDTDEFVESGNEVLWNDKVIYTSFSFGPVIVRDGKAITNYEGVEAAIHGMYLTGKAKVARAAIGQIGPLHYLLCTVDGTRNERYGITIPQLAEVMVEKGCVAAYNLDGGHSATLIFNDRIVNYPAAKDDSGTQRSQSDAIYFATAIPNE